MGARDIVNEGSTAYLSVSFKDKAGALATPASLTYSLRCLTTGAVLRDAVPLTASSQVEITLTPADNTLQNPGNLYETRLLTIVAGYGASDALQDQYEYLVKNLAGL